MHRKFVALMSAGALTVSTGLVTATAGSASQVPAPSIEAACGSNAYTASCRNCHTIPARGGFSIGVPGAAAALRGTGSARTAGTRLCLAQVSRPHPSLGGIGMRVSATGRFSPLRLSRGTLYWYERSTNKTVVVKSVSRAGIYQVVVR